jgi:hypothetical protein
LTGDIFGFFAAAGALAALLGLIAIWAPRRVWIKITALTTTALFLLVGYVSLVDLLSRPKPVDMEWAHANAADAAVLGVHMEEDKAIYLWLGFTRRPPSSCTTPSAPPRPRAPASGSSCPSRPRSTSASAGSTPSPSRPSRPSRRRMAGR